MNGHSWRRTITKAVTYRIASFTAATAMLGYLLKIPLNLSIGYNILAAGVSFLIFVGNEMAWRRTSWGKK